MPNKLCIAVPTFNRSGKLKKLLYEIEQQLSVSEYKSEISVIVSDNGSSDNTKEIALDFVKNNKNFEYFGQPENMGFDRNIEFLYKKAEAEYVWFFSDDDILFANAIDTIFCEISKSKTDVLLFSFVQPPGSSTKTFDFNKPTELISSQDEIIELVIRYPKLSIYLIKKIELSADSNRYLTSTIGKGFYFVSLAYSVLHQSDNAVIAIISKPLAGCDDEYNHFEINPDIFLHSYETLQHPYILDKYPEIYLSRKVQSYLTTIEYLFKIKTGNFIVKNMNFYDSYIKRLDTRISILMKNPLFGIKFILIKLGLVSLYLSIGNKIYYAVVKPIINNVKR